MTDGTPTITRRRALVGLALAASGGGGAWLPGGGGGIARAAAAAAAADDGAGAKPVRLLFAGSSSTYFNDLPDAVARAVGGQVDGRPGAPAVAALVGRSGSDIRVYSEPGFKDYQYGVRPGQTFLDRVREERFDFVVLQAVCRFAAGDGSPANPDGAAHLDALARYVEAARAAGGEPLVYEMGWGRGEKDAQGRRRLRDLAARCRVRHYAPCSSAWERVYRERPDLKLQHPSDAAHPGDVGHFLNVACFYAALTRRSPEGKVPRTYPVWTHFTKEEKQARREEIARRAAAFTPTPYQASLPKWMRESPAWGATCTVDPETARYLERVAWEEWQGIDRALGAAAVTTGSGKG